MIIKPNLLMKYLIALLLLAGAFPAKFQVTKIFFNRNHNRIKDSAKAFFFCY